ncbi:MAG: recombinase family protein [Polyangia bacterium]
MKLDQNKQAVAYLRVNDGSAAKLRQQREQLTEWASRHRVVLRSWHADCSSGTARLRERPGLHAALSALQAGSVELLVVASADGLTRSLAQRTNLRRRLSAANVLLRSVDRAGDAADTDADPEQRDRSDTEPTQVRGS